MARAWWPPTTTASRWRPSMAARRACWFRTSTSGNRPSGSAGCVSWSTTSRASGSRSATTSTATPGASSAMLAIDQSADTTGRRLRWRGVEVVETAPETARATTLVLDVEGWPGHRAGQHVDIRLTAEDGYQRSYSIASPPEAPRLALTVERLDGGQVSPLLAGEASGGRSLRALVADRRLLRLDRRPGRPSMSHGRRIGHR